MHEIARLYSIPVQTFYRRMKDMGILMRQKYSTMSDAEHDQHVINISSENQLVGEKIIRARLQAVHGQTVTRQKNRDVICNTIGP